MPQQNSVPPTLTADDVALMIDVAKRTDRWMATLSHAERLVYGRNVKVSKGHGVADVDPRPDLSAQRGGTAEDVHLFFDVTADGDYVAVRTRAHNWGFWHISRFGGKLGAKGIRLWSASLSAGREIREWEAANGH